MSGGRPLRRSSISTDAPRIDAHHHLWDLAVRDQPWTAGLPALRRTFALDELHPHLAAHEIVGTVVVQTVSVAEETPELLTLAAREPVIAGVVGWMDLTAPDVAARLAELRAHPGGQRLVGIRHQVQDEPDPRWLCRPDVRRGLTAVAAAGLVYDLLITPHQLPAAIETVNALPELRFVLDHAGKPRIRTRELAPWSSDITELARRPNVDIKLSGLVTEADAERWTVDDLRPYAEVLLDVFGPQRIMFGSDWPVCLLAGAYDDAWNAAVALTDALAPGEREAVLGGTAIRTYRLAPR